MKLYYFLLILLLPFASCSFVARKVRGIKKLQIENEQSIMRCMKAKGLNTANVLSVIPEEFYEYATGIFAGKPMLFERNSGKFLAIGFTNGSYCPKEVDKSFNKVLPYNLIKGKPDSFFIIKSRVIPKEEVEKRHDIKALLKDEQFLKNDTITPRLSYMISSLRTLKGDEPTLFKDSAVSSEYFLFLPFAKWLGNRIQVKELKRIYNAAIFNMFSRIQVVFVNTDKQEWWGKEWNDKINVNFY